MRIDNMICFPWRCYGECDATVLMSFYVVGYCTADEFIVNDICGVLCSDVTFSDGRAPLPWSQHSQLLDQFEAVFKVCYAEDVCDLQDEVQDFARSVLGPSMCGATLVNSHTPNRALNAVSS